MLSFAHLVFLEGTILPIEKPPSCEAASYSDAEVKQNDASLDCLLRNATEGDYIKYLLQPTEKKNVTTDCFIPSIICFLIHLENLLYTIKR